ncbi:MAG: chemotaxis protein CheW [Polyangiaceae bacterium]|jgi:two-component system chemotaxis sensor kinase CheA
MTVGDEEIFREFLVESTENLDQLDRDFVALESNPAAADRIAGIFRTIHTIKGTSGFLGLTQLETLTHAGENVLSKLRDGHLKLTPEITSTLLSMVDAVRRILRCVETSSTEGTEDYRHLVDQLASLCKQRVPPLGEILMQSGAIDPKTLAEALEQQKDDSRKLGEILVANGHVKAQAVIEALETQQEVRAAISDTSIRVDVGLLDKLMNLVGELVLARNQILQFAGQSKDSSFLGTSQRLNLLTTELQEGVMKTRMQPIGSVWNKFPRVVRDLALTCRKQVKLEMIGEETDLDRTIIEAIKDPLTHLVRNSVDHGIEAPEVRVSRGKSSVGKLLLRAYHEGGQVNIEISDDGAGIEPQKMRDHATARGLITPERAGRMGDRESLNLIFLPGFSTAEKVTSVSGRGVGMDVVKTNIEKIGGTVDVQSKAGQGTTLKIKIPLTLAIIPALVVTSHTERFAIPQVSLLELVRLEGEQARTGVEHINGAPVYRLRGNILPLVYLNRTLNFPDAGPAQSGAVNIVVLQADDRQFGLVVDGVSDTEEIVVKPLGKELKGLSAFAGATIMGDGRVALILDVLGIAQRANVISEIRDRNLVEEVTKAAKTEDQKRAVLLFRVRDEARMAIPLSMVARLEEFPRKRLERSSGRHVVQYRGRILPLIDLCGVMDERARDDEGPLQVVVYSEHGRSVGLIVDRILDIVEESITEEQRAAGHSVIGSAVIAGQVTDLLDVHGVIRQTDPGFFERSTAA